MENMGSKDYLRSFLGKKLHLHTTDARMFVGDFKCTDNECNIILSGAFEYREPSPQAIHAATAGHSSRTRVKVDMTSRFLGLIVVPGQHITKIEVQDPSE